MGHRMIVGLLGMLAAGLIATPTYAQFPTPPKKKKEEKKELRFEKGKPNTNLDEEQKAQIERLDKMFQKLYGFPEVPDDAKQLVRDAMYAALNGIHQPEREHSDQLTNQLMEVLRDKQLGSYYAHKLVSGTAELLSADELSKEEYDGLMVDIEQNLSGSRMSSERHNSLKETVATIIMNAKVNEKKVEEREKAREAEKERQEKERKRKLEEAKKKAERQNRRGGEYSMP